MSATEPPFSTLWCDGRSVPADLAVVKASDSGFLDGLGCYTTVLCEKGVPRWPERHARRLTRDAHTIGLAALALDRTRAAIRDAARATLAGATGALRVQCTRDGDDDLRLIGLPRTLGDDPPEWQAVAATVPHWGAMPWGGAKITSHWPAALARAEAKRHGADEALLFDRDDHLIEGARSNVVVQLASGEVVTPDLARGGVSGVARSLLLERFAAASTPLVVRDIARSELTSARAVVAINALRWGRRIASLDGRPLGDERGDALVWRIARALQDAPDLDPDDAGVREAG